MLPQNTEISVFSTGKDEVMLAVCFDESAIIDISDGSLTRLDMAATYAHENGITEFDTLILTHYHTKHLSAVSRFIDEEMVRRVILPYPSTEDDAWIMAQLVDVIQSSGLTCEIALPNNDFKLVGKGRICLSQIARIERSTHPILYLKITEREETITYLTGSSWESDGEFKSSLGEITEQSDMLIIGAHGPVIKSYFDIPINLDKTVRCLIFDPENAEFIVGPNGTLTKEIEVIVGGNAYKIAFGDTSG
jgi:hypothetical protein